MAIVNATDKIGQINVTLEQSKTMDVGFYKNSRADIIMSCTYIKSGQQEIQDYTNNVCKPEMDDYIISKADKAFQPLINEARISAQSAKDSARECAAVVSGLNIENIVAIEANYRTEADEAIRESLNSACQRLETGLSEKADKAAVYNKAENDMLLSAKADLASPQFSGTPTVPTAGKAASELQAANLAAVRSNISESLCVNGLYQTITLNDTQWCREWFSDQAKTQRVWMEQGGKLVKNDHAGVTQYIFTFLVPFNNQDYYFSRSQEHNFDGAILTCHAWNGYHDKTTTGIKYFIDNDYVTTSIWYACGR